MTWIDIHTHLDMLEEGPEEALRLAKEAGVSKVITIGTESEDHPKVVALARKYPGEVYCTLGVHPHHGDTWNDTIEKWVVQHLPERGVVAVGEIGLDYYYLQSNADAQKASFRRQMEIAEQFQLPVEIHTRDAEPDTVEILKEFKGRVGGVIHCFTGTEFLAKNALDCGFNISFSGVVTFKNAQPLRDICKWVPDDRFHVETDAPFLAPVPMRGRKNTPAFVVHTAKAVAEIRGVPLEKLAEQAFANTRQLFPKMLLGTSASPK